MNLVFFTRNERGISANVRQDGYRLEDTLDDDDDDDDDDVLC